MSETNLFNQIEAITNQKNVPDRHSFYQLKCFVIGKELTHQARLRQCILELKARKASLEAVELEIADQEDNLLLINLDIEEAGKIGIDSARTDVHVRKMRRKKLQTERHILQLREKRLYIAEEALFLVETYNKLSKVEQIKDWDSIEVQQQYWNEKLKYELNMKLLSNQTPDGELLKTILALDNEAPLKKEVLVSLKRKTDELKLAEQKQIEQHKLQGEKAESLPAK